MLKTLSRILVLFIALWLPLQGYAAVSESLCSPSAQAGAVEMDTATAYTDEQHSGMHRCFDTATIQSDGDASAASDHAAGHCFNGCVGCPLLPASIISPPDAPSIGANFIVIFQPPHVIDAPQRPPRTALS